MKGLLSAIVAAAMAVPDLFAGTPIQTNSFVRRDIAFSSDPLDFAVGEWKSTSESLVAVVTTNKLEIVAMGTDALPVGNALAYDAPGATGPIAMADIDGDGLKDILYGAGTNVVVRFNTSSATSPAFDLSATFGAAAPGVPRMLAVADLDGDGKPDILYVTAGVFVSFPAQISANIFALRNESSSGSVSFAPPVQVFTNAASVQMADIDGDGLVDLAVAASSGPFGLLLQNTSSAGQIKFVQRTLADPPPVLLDMNGDSLVDQVSITRLAFPRPGEPENTLKILLNTSQIGSIAFAKGTSVGLDIPNYDFGSKLRSILPSFRPNIAAADFNQDGRIDLVDAYLTNRLVIVQNGAASPLDFATWEKGVALPAFLYPYEPTIADVNHDGRPDVVIGSGSRYISIFENQITPTPEIIVLIDPAQAGVNVGDVVRLRAAVHGADVSAVEYIENGQVIATATSADGFSAQFGVSSVGLHTISARATAGADTGLISKPAGLRVRDPNIGHVVALGSGVMSQATYLLFDSGRAFGVGSNSRGQLADIFYDPSHIGFVEIPLQTNVGGWKQISSGQTFAIGLTVSNRVFSWGANDFGQLGRPIGIVTNPVPAEIDFSGATVVKIGAGMDFTVAIDADGELYAWGGNGNGQLGRSNTVARATPAKLRRPEGVSRWSDFSVGHQHVLALDDTGRLFGWGWNYWGQVGQPRTNAAVLTPTLIELPPGEIAWTNVTAGVVASYAQTASGRVYRWGNYVTDAGPVYDPTVKELPVPSESGGLKLIGDGSALTAALANDGDIYVWGGGILARTGLGDGNAVTNPTRLPLPAGVSGWTNLFVAMQRAAAITDDGQVYTWGFDLGYALGNGKVDAYVPTPVCLPLQSCASNQPAFIRILHPTYGDNFPSDGVVHLEIATDDDHVVDTTRILKEQSLNSLIELARAGFGETNIAIPAAQGPFATLYAAAYDRSGSGRTSAPVFLTFPTSSSLSATVNLDATAPTNEISGWQEAYAGLRNDSSFRFASLTAVLSNLPPGIAIRGASNNVTDNTATLMDPFGLSPRENTRFRIEYRLPDGVTNAQLRVYFAIGDNVPHISVSGDLQPLALTVLTNGLRMLEFDQTSTGDSVVQFTDSFTNWFNAGGSFEAAGDKFRWLDGGPPATSKHPAAAAQRFYRVLRTR